MNFKEKSTLHHSACIWIHIWQLLALNYTYHYSFEREQNRQRKREERERKIERDNVFIEKSLKLWLFDLNNVQQIFNDIILFFAFDFTCILDCEMQSLIAKIDNILEKV